MWTILNNELFTCLIILSYFKTSKGTEKLCFVSANNFIYDFMFVHHCIFKTHFSNNYIIKFILLLLWYDGILSNGAGKNIYILNNFSI